MEEIEKNNDKRNEDRKNELNKKIDFKVELALFLILGFLLGVVIKTEAVKRITIGYNDGAIKSVRQGYDFEKIEKDIAEKNNPAGQSAPETAQPNVQAPSGSQSAPQGNN
jgi:hypothetical protein